MNEEKVFITRYIDSSGNTIEFSNMMEIITDWLEDYMNKYEIEIPDRN